MNLILSTDEKWMKKNILVFFSVFRILAISSNSYDESEGYLLFFGRIDLKSNNQLRNAYSSFL